MKVLLSWLKEYVDIDVTVPELEEKFFGAGFEVEETKYLGEGISNVVVGQVTAMEHYEGTHLEICTMDLGEHGKDVIILTGADNVFVGAKVPAAMVGAVLPGGFKIKERKMLEKMSYGMLCAGEELGIAGWYPGDEVNGILILPDDAPVGANIVDVLGLDDYIFDISITANRPDCQCILGLAREVAAFLGKPLKHPDLSYTMTEVKNDDIKVYDEAYDLCPRFLGHYIYDVKHFESPLWMKQRLASCDMKAIDAVVDITNYVLLEIGQPMHAYDLATLNGSTVYPRRARDKEMITTLDGKERELTSENLVICDAKEPIGLAGIMGGLDSEITEKTTEIVLEAAKFVRDNVRRSCRSLGVHTDAAGRFEKGVDEYSVETGMKRCLNLVETLGVAKISSTAFDCSGGASTEERKISVSADRVNKVLGITVPTADMECILKALGFGVEVSGDNMEITVPRYREDVSHYQDIAEEIIREYGYDHITPRFIESAKVTNGGLSPAQQRENAVRDLLCDRGLFEISTMAMYSPADLDALFIPQDAPERNYISILNPITENLSIVRPMLVPSMLNIIINNIKAEHAGGRFFELAPVYIPKGLPVSEYPDEPDHLCIGLYGPDEDFYSLKAVVDSIADAYGLDFSYERAEVSYLHPGRSAALICNGHRIGTLGQLRYEIVDSFAIAEGKKADAKVFLAELDYTLLARQFAPAIRFTPLSDKESRVRDISLLVDTDTQVGDMIASVKKISKLAKEVNLADIYCHEKLGAGKKSVTLSIRFATADHSVTDEEADGARDKVVKKLSEEYGAVARV
ncbi:MAG: phenylalanine--tRNA ligase subunit beta [Lachnospiraceae bacterium]|nr:phenylalanine--tRNA ligase subunit beta [Lachnospiraceae bacterium]